ncbi:transcriptional regulator, TetR family [Rhizobiales bacterium GAS191]|jgi:AcrR family transcriptional regulator|nr:transcriptional regulator, TetR family [Rhizobiales bacterium GAS113]SEB93329.1 transcriptional regulator, TetR family [Rhizobiales bacterium GAS191]
MTASSTLGRRDKLKEKLILASEELIETQGLSGVKARPLAEAAGCALGAIYTVFPDLDALILAVSARTLARLDAHLAPALDGPAALGATQRETARRRLVDLALAYLDFAHAHRARWRALFEHRLPEGRSVPEWLVADQARLFGKVEALLEPLMPLTAVADRALLARSLFSAVHGVVLLGLEEKLTAMPMGILLDQVASIVSALVRGLEEQAPSRGAGA